MVQSFYQLLQFALRIPNLTHQKQSHPFLNTIDELKGALKKLILTE